jgi:hypothetical protein
LRRATRASIRTADLDQFLPKRWQEHLETYWQPSAHALYRHHALSALLAADRARDAWPPTGGPPGSDLAFMQKQHLDPLDVEYGILQVLDLFIFSQQNLEFGAAIQRAINDWQLAFWSDRDPRLKASILAGQDDTQLAIAEIEPLRQDRRIQSRSTSRRAPTSRSAAAATGRSMPAHRNWACRSAYTSAAMAATRRPAAAGRPIIAKSTSRTRTPWRPR